MRKIGNLVARCDRSGHGLYHRRYVAEYRQGFTGVL